MLTALVLTASLAQTPPNPNGLGLKLAKVPVLVRSIARMPPVTPSLSESETLATRIIERADYNGRHLAAITDRGGTSTRATIWDARTGALVRRIDGHREAVWSVALAPGGRAVLTSSYRPNNGLGALTKDDSIRLWDIADERELLRLEDATQGRWSRDGRRILGFARRPGGLPSAKRFDVAAWDARSGRKLFTARVPGEGAVPYEGLTLQEAARAPKLLFLQRFEATIYDARTGKAVGGDLKLSRQSDGSGFIAPDGRTVRLHTGDSVTVFSAAGGIELGRVPFLGSGFSRVAWSSNGRRFVRVDPVGGEVESHDPEEGRAVLAAGDGLRADSAVFAPDDASFAVNFDGSNEIPRRVQAYDARTGATLWVAEGRLVGYTGRGEAVVLDLSKNQFSLREALTGRSLRAVGLTPAGPNVDGRK